MKKHLYDEIAKRWLKKNGTVWVYSDPHFSDLDSYKLRGVFSCITEEQFNETKITNYTYKQFLQSVVKTTDELQIKNINSKVGKNDTLIILGDVGNIECVKKLKAGYKVLIMGNHDKGASNYKKEIYHDTRFIDEFPKDFIPEEHGYQVVDPTPVGNLYDKVITNGLFDEVYEGPLMINDRVILSHEPISVPDGIMFNIHGHVHNKHYKGDSQHLNCCAEVIDYEPVNLIKLMDKGLLKDTKDIHRCTIDKRL